MGNGKGIFTRAPFCCVFCDMRFGHELGRALTNARDVLNMGNTRPLFRLASSFSYSQLQLQFE